MQEHISSQHVGQSSEQIGCPLCSLVLASQMELQEHLISLHVEPQGESQEAGDEQPSASLTVRSSYTVYVPNWKYSSRAFCMLAGVVGHTHKRDVTRDGKHVDKHCKHPQTEQNCVLTNRAPQQRQQEVKGRSSRRRWQTPSRCWSLWQVEERVHHQQRWWRSTCTSC